MQREREGLTAEESERLTGYCFGLTSLHFAVNSRPLNIAKKSRAAIVKNYS